MRAQPSVAEERRVLLGGRAQAWCRSGFIDRESRDRIRAAAKTHWKPSSLFSRIVLFALTLVCVAAFFNLLELTHIPAAGILTAIVCTAIAEFLILQRRFFHIGPEEALYLAGWSALVFDLRVPADERLLLLALAAAVAGLRVLNDFFFVLAVALMGFYLGAKTDHGGAAAIYCVALAVAALLAMTRRTARPTWARTLSSTIFVLPAVGFLILKYHPFGRGSLTFAALLGFALVAGGFLAAGLAWRFHSAIFSSLIVIALLIADVSERLAWRAELQLLLWGTVALLVAVVAERALRRPRRAITSVRLMDPGSLDLLESAAIGAISTPAAAPQEHRGGGEFGGGGASGRY